MRYFFYLTFLFFSITHTHAQRKVNLEEKLQDLHIAMEGEITMADIEEAGRVKMYLDNGTVIKRRKAEKYLNPEKYDRLIYVDEDSDIKAFVFTPIADDNISSGNEEIDISPKEKAISFYVTDIHNKTYKLSDLKGKVVVMNYWFSACRPCVMEMPELNKLVDKYKGQDVVFLGFTYHIKANILRFLNSYEFKYNLIPESQIEILNYQVKTYPTHIVIDKNGFVVLREEGLNYDTVDILDKTIEKLLEK